MAEPNFGKRKAIIFGNLMVSEEGNTVQLSLLTEVKGRPYALFTKNELPGLTKLLNTIAKVGTPVIEHDDLDGSNLL